MNIIIFSEKNIFKLNERNYADMDKKTKKENEKALEEFSALDDITGVASATECTGLMQIPPLNSEQAEAYGEIYEVPKQVNIIPKKHTKK